MPKPPVPFDLISARIAARQEAGRRHRETMYQRRLEQNYAHKRVASKRARAAEDIALIRRYEALKQARAAATGEIAALVEDQERDEKWGSSTSRRAWLVSLDAEHESRDDEAGGKWTLYDVIPG